LSVSAAIGLIALFGQAAFDGSLVRMRTVLMMTLLAMLGLTPMAPSHSIGSEVQRPLAVVIIGGLFSAAALTLVVLPALYVTFEGRHHHHTPPEAASAS
jgi:cobalt-zinc-cadmium resistance protein CzcA